MTHTSPTMSRMELTHAAPQSLEIEKEQLEAVEFETTQIAVVTPLAPRERFFRLKYGFDRAAGTSLLVLTSPLTILLYLLVRTTSRGPGFYRQRRVGLNGRVFEIVKLRTMVVDAEKPGQAVWCVKNDSRITPLGRVLRRLHLDELPQLWNVARGEMSLVGPRPERPEICERLAESIDGYYERVTIKPGVTGLSQINLPPDETLEDVQRKQVLDLQYIQEANPWLEARILAATGMRMLGLRGEAVMRSMRLCRRHILRDANLLSDRRSGGHTAPETFAACRDRASVAPRRPR